MSYNILSETLISREKYSTQKPEHLATKRRVCLICTELEEAKPDVCFFQEMNENSTSLF